MKVLIVGNVLKDVYLRLDERHNSFENDENKNPWLNVCFDGSTHEFFRRNSVFGGATVTLEVLKKFGLDAEISCSKVNYDEDELVNIGKTDIYRYILCCGDKISYFTPSQRVTTDWQVPEYAIDWILIDRSANIDKKLVEQIKTFLSVSQHTKLAVFLKKYPVDAYAQLAVAADLIFTESELTIRNKQICTIGEKMIFLDDIKQSWRLPRKDLLTHLTANSIIAASVLGAVINEKSPIEALKLAKLNVENATLDRTVSLSRLEEMLEDY